MLLFLLSIVSAQLAPLEPNDGKVLFGPWYANQHGDSPTQVLDRFKYRKFSLWQADINISSTIQMDLLDRFEQHMDSTNSSAIMYLTIYPDLGFDSVTDGALKQLVDRVVEITNKGRKMFIRYASEMNGSWFRYGQQPRAFIQSWRKVVDAIRSAIKSRDLVAFIWAPNSANGYPFAGNTFSARNDSADIDLMDTNGNGGLDAGDDPYTPFYPGDDYVDWVGYSVYHYGREYPWETNDIPVAGKVESIITGRNGFGNFNMYRMFCQDGVGGRPVSRSKGGKPFIITETGSTYHLYKVPDQTIPQPGAGPVAIKRAWWNQIFNSTFLSTYPKIKAVSTFEFIKFEETTWRDFTILGNPVIDADSPRGRSERAHVDDVLNAFRSDLTQNKLSDLIIWANDGNPNTDSPTGKPSNNNAGSVSAIGGLFAFFLLSFYSI
jgi:hypothetical protein